MKTMFDDLLPQESKQAQPGGGGMFDDLLPAQPTANAPESLQPQADDMTPGQRRGHGAGVVATEDRPGIIEEARRGVMMGVRGVQQGYHGTRAMLTDDEDTREHHMGRFRDLGEQTQADMISVPEFTEIRSLGDFGRWTVGQAAAMTPIVGSIMAGGAAGGKMGATGGALLGPKGAAAGGIVGSAIGSFTVGYKLYAGGMYGDIVEMGGGHDESKKAALTYGIPASAVSIVVPAAATASVMGYLGRDFVKNKMKTAMTGAGLGMVAEGGAEAIAESFVIAGEESVLGRTMTDEERTKRIINAGMAGGLMGIGTGAIGGGGRKTGDIDTMIDAYLDQVEADSAKHIDPAQVRGNLAQYLESAESLTPQQASLLQYLKTNKADSNRNLNQAEREISQIAFDVYRNDAASNAQRMSVLTAKQDQLTGSEAMELVALMTNSDAARAMAAEQIQQGADSAGPALDTIEQQESAQQAQIRQQQAPIRRQINQIEAQLTGDPAQDAPLAQQLQPLYEQLEQAGIIEQTKTDSAATREALAAEMAERQQGGEGMGIGQGGLLERARALANPIAAQEIDPSIRVPDWDTAPGATPDRVNALDGARASVNDLMAQGQASSPAAVAESTRPKMGTMRERLARIRQEREARQNDPYTIDFEPTPVPSPLEAAGTSPGAAPQTDAIDLAQPVAAPNLGIESDRQADRRVATDKRIAEQEAQLGDAKQPEGLGDPRIKRLSHRVQLRRLGNATLPDTGSKKINPAVDDILTAIAKAGGLSIEDAKAQGIDPAHFRDKAGLANPFRKDGMSFDAMAENLAQYGYTPADYSANGLLEQVSDALGGSAIYSMNVDMDAVSLLDDLRLVEGMTPQQTQKAIKKAIAGERLGVGQARAVVAALDQITGERAEQVEYVRRELQKARDIRALNKQGLTDAEVQAQVEMAGEMFAEVEYNPEWTGEHRAIFELINDAEALGVDADAIESAASVPDNAEAARRLWALINEAKTNEQQAEAIPGTPVGDRQVEGEQGQGPRPAAPGATEGAGEGASQEVDLFGTVPVQEQAMADAKRKVDERLRGTGDTPAAESAGDLLSPGRAQQTDITTQTPADAGVSASKVDAAAQQAETNPSDAQKEAGNYKKGHITLHGLEITIENPRGSTRSGTDAGGRRWETTMAHHYGYFKRTTGKDGDHVDVFLTENAEDASRPVFIIDQVDPETRRFDEHKVVMGAASDADARAAYLANYEDGWNGIGAVTEMDLQQFKDWLAEGDTTARAEESAAQEGDQQATPITTPPDTDPFSEVTLRSEYPTQDATNAYMHSSLHPRDAGRSHQDGYVKAVRETVTEMQPLAETDAQQTVLDEQMRQFKAEYLQREKSVLRAREGTVSGHIAGRSKFNSRQASNRGNALDRAQEAFDSWLKQAKLGIKDAIQAARTGEQKARDHRQAADSARNKEFEGHMVTIARAVGAMQDPGMDKAAFRPKATKALKDALAMDRDRTLDMLGKIDAAIEGEQGLGGVMGTRSDFWKTYQAAINETEQATAAEAQPDQEASAIAILDRANVTGKERLDIIKDYRDGKYSLADLESAYPAASETAAETDTAGDAVSETVAQEAGEQKPATQIQDFGEKIGGARKDVWREYADTLGKATRQEIADQQFSKVWPEPNYQKMIDEGAAPRTVGLLRALRDQVPNKPRSSWKLKSWVGQVETLQQVASNILTDKRFASAFSEGVDVRAGLNEVSNLADLYAEVGHDKSLKGLRFTKAHYALYKGEKDVTKWVIEQRARSTALSNMPRTIAAEKTKEAAIAKFKEALANNQVNKPANKTVRFEIGTYTGGENAGKTVIYKKVGREKVVLETFDNVQDARDYLQKNEDALTEKLEKFKQIPNHRKETNSPRVGADHRNGADVTPEQFTEAFGFRGVEFGNYVEQARRQKDLNRSYDAMMDLAGVLNVPSRAMSLNGELGIAFGARGTGGKDAPAAHYEAGKIVINLTKREGAGSLAHEWFHAMDNYFSRMRGDKHDYITERGDATKEGVRQEVAEAFRQVQRAITKTRIKERSKKLDRAAAKAYWQTGREMNARAFESYVIEKLKDENVSNDYLANIVSQEYWDAAARLGMEKEDSYPYPQAAEIPVVREAFDRLFEVIETKADDAGNVAMFSRGGSSDRLDFAAQAWATIAASPDAAKTPRSQSTDMVQIAKEVAPGMRAAEVGAEGDGLVNGWTFTNKNGETALVMERDDGTVYVNILSFNEGGGGSDVYNAVSTYAHNNNLTFIGDPAGLEPIANYRRTENILSSAIKFGTTRHIKPHPSQNIRWVDGDDKGNLARLIRAHYTNAIKAMPELSGVYYDARTGEFRRARSERAGEDAGRAWRSGNDATGAGRSTRSLGTGWFDRVARRSPAARQAGLGSSTLRRIALTNTFLRAKGGEMGRLGILEAISHRLSEPLGKTDPLAGLLYSKPQAPATAGVSVSAPDTQKWIDAITAKMAGAPKIHVVQNMQDKQVPERVRQVDAEQRSQGATGEPEGFFYRGEAYIVLDGVTKQAGESDGQAVFRVFAHEVLGHAGLRGAFKADLDAVLKEVALKRRADVRDKAGQYGLDMRNEGQRLQAAEEVLAEMAQSTPENSMVTKAVEAVRRALRRLYLKLPASVKAALGKREFVEWVNSMTDAEIVDRFLVPAREFIRAGEGVAPSIIRPAFSRDTNPDTIASPVEGEATGRTEKLPETIAIDGKERQTTNSEGKPIHPTREGVENFYRWFGDSKVVDEQGRPLVVYHGSGEAFNAFNASRLGENTGYGDAEVGFHFSDNNADADFYATKAAERLGKERGVVRKFFLSLKTPLIVGMDETDGNAGTRTQEFLDDKNAAKEYAEANGHDGIIYLYGTNVDSGYTAIAFAPTQIKSATGNAGEFSPDTADIRFSRQQETSNTPDAPPAEASELPAGATGTYKIDHHAKNMALLRAFWDSASDVLRRNHMGKLADAIDNYYDSIDRRRGEIDKRVRPVLKEIDALPRKQRDEVYDSFRRYQAAKENGRKQTAQNLYDNSPHLRKLADTWDWIADHTGTINQEVGVQVFDPKLNKWREIGKVKGFFPRTMNQEAQEALANPAKHPEMFNKLVDALIAEGHIETREEAVKYISNHYSDRTTQDYFAGMEKARTMPLPEVFYDYSWDAAMRYRESWLQRVGQIEQFGQKTGRDSKDLFDQHLSETFDPETQAYLSEIRKNVYMERDKDGMSRFLANTNMLATGLQLGNPFTAFRNLVGGSLLTFANFGNKASLMAYRSMAKDGVRAAYEDAYAIGVLKEDLIALQHDAQAQGVSENLSKFTGGMMKWGGYKVTEQWIRVHAMLTGRHFLQDALKHWNKNQGGRKSKQYMAFMQRHNIDVGKLLTENGKGEETNKWLRLAVNIPQGSYKINMVPLFTDTPLGRFLFKYQKFGTQVSRAFWQQQLRPFIKGEKVTWTDASGQTRTDKVHAFLPMAQFFATAIFGGTVLAKMLEAIFGTVDPGPGLDEIEKALEDPERREAWGLIFSRSYSSFMTVGMTGFLGNYMQMTLDVRDRQRVKNPMSPPGLAPIEAVGELLLRWVDQGSLDARDFDQVASRTVSIYRAGKRGTMKTLDLVTDDLREVNLEMARRDRLYVRKLTRRFADETNLAAKKRHSGSFTGTEMTPVTRRVTEELILGNPESAKAIAREYMMSITEKHKDDPTKAVREIESAWASITGSVRAFDPARVATAPSEFERHRFLKWVNGRVSDENYQRVRRVTDGYRDAAVQAGMMKRENEIKMMMEELKRDMRGSIYGTPAGAEMLIDRLIGWGF